MRETNVTREHALKMISDVKKRIKEQTGKSWDEVNRHYLRSDDHDWVLADCRVVVALNTLVRKK